MSGRTNPTVNNLRAMFEQNRDSISPPSRGRSPAGSESATGDNLRPISKVRTSFVPVEWSGQMGPSNGVTKLSDNAERNSGGESRGESHVAVDVTPSNVPKLNGDGIQHSPPKTGTEDSASMAQEKALDEKDKAGFSISDHSMAPPANATDTTFQKLETETKTGTDVTPTPESKNVEDLNEVSEPHDESQDLGAILKGAPFEQVSRDNSNALESQELVVPSSTPSTPKQASTSSPEASTSRSKPGSISKASPTKHASSSPRSLSVSTKKPVTKAPKSTATAPTENSGRSPKTPKSPSVAGSQAPSKTASPRQQYTSRAPNNVTKESKKESVPKTARISAGAKVLKAPATKPEKSAPAPTRNPVKKTGPTSPTTKPRPKSPTRPVRLPGAATASTASSAAKLGEAAPARSPSRASVTNGSKAPVLAKDRAATSSNPRKPPARASLSNQASVGQKPKARLSMASAKAPEESFLARMMRPTQSSASKTHEKVEHAPTKSIPIRPKGKSGGSGEDAKGRGSEEPPAMSQPDDDHGPAPIAGTSGDVADETDGAPADTTLGQ